MAVCSICGGEYDEWAYQVVVPELRASFHSYECAQLARRKQRRTAAAEADLPPALLAEIDRLRELSERPERIP